MNIHCTQLLRRLAHEPRTMKSLTHGESSAHPTAITAWLDRLMDLGYVEASGSHNERRYSITYSGERALSNLPETASSRYLCNASMTSTYTPPAWTPARAGADSHRRLPSLGGC